MAIDDPITPANSDAYEKFRQGRHFGSLDGLRALSVVAVVWHHTVGHAPDLPTLFSNGFHGVTLFFAISGFLIVTLLLREFESTGRIRLRAFYVRRALRIFPLYFVVLTLYVILVSVLERQSPAGREFFRNLIYFATYTANWFVLLEGRVIFYFAWSLAAEEQFYMVWPWLQKSLKPAGAVSVMLVLVSALIVLQWVGPPSDGELVPLWYRMLVSIPLAICFGVVLAHLLHNPRSFSGLHWLFGWRWSSVAFLLIALAILSFGTRYSWAVHLAAALMVGACVYREDHALARLLACKPLVYVGSISYGMYLLNMLVKNAVVKGLLVAGWHADAYTVFLATLAGSLMVATLSFRYFESHFLKMKVRFS